MENFKKTTVKLGKVPYIMYKGIVNVRIDRSDSLSAYIALPVHLFKSPSETPAEPIYWMEGGPGYSNLKKPIRAFLDNHDVVFVGYRGIDAPVMKKSRKLAKAFRGMDNHLFSEESLDNIGIKVKEYLDELAEDGIDINHFTIIDVIDDFEDVRIMLEHQKIILYSASYGTRVALLYSYRYPDAIKRSLMVAANPPGHFIWYPEYTSRILQTYNSLYVIQADTGEISIEKSIKESFDHLPGHWSCFKLDADKIKTATFYLLFDRNTAVMAFDAYRRAAMKGDYSGLYLMQLVYDYVPASNYGDGFCKAASADYDPEINYRRLFKAGNTEIGAPASMLYWGSSNNWPIKQIDEEYRKPKITNTETLIVSGNLDNSTPAEIATKELLPFLPNGKQVILKDMAHYGNLVYIQYDAFKNLALRYFDDGMIDTSKFTCDPVNFKPKRSFNKLAKTFYPLVFVLSIIR